MDTSDPEIEFDSDGVCTHCLHFDAVTSKRWFPNSDGRDRLVSIVERVKHAGQGREYDCVLGLSGGVDSSYLALRVRELGLRALALHVDAGWNSEVAVSNIEKTVKYCGFDLETDVLDWGEVRDLQLAYLRSGVANQDVPQDHAFFAALYRAASSRGIRFVLSGGNISTESVLPVSWQGPAMDRRSLRAIHRRFGNEKLNTYPTIGFLEYYVINPYVRRLKVIRPLNYMPYVRSEALNELRGVLGFQDYGRKHGESHFTRFFQNYYLPQRFGFDKRRPHLSSLILSGQLSREEAVAELSEPLYEQEELDADKAFVAKKLRLTLEELDDLIDIPRRSHSDYPSNARAYAGLKRIQRAVERVSGNDMRSYG